MEAEMTLRPMTAAEQMYSYSQSQQISMQTGLIGYLRADMDNSGKVFFSSWNGFRDSLKSEDFKQEFEEVLNELREDGNLLHDRNTLGRYCHRTPDSSFHNDRNEYGTNHYLYRCYKPGIRETQIDLLKEKILAGTATRSDITRVTRRLGDEIAKVYGFSIPRTRQPVSKER